MGKILNFETPERSVRRVNKEHDYEIVSSTEDALLFINHTMYGSDNEAREINLGLCQKLLRELADHLDYLGHEDMITFSKESSDELINRYPDVFQ